MAKHIKCEDAYRTLSDYYHHSTDNQHMALKEALERVPAADVVERKTGKWIEIRMGSINPLTGRAGVYVGCSECHASIPSDSQLDFIDESDCKFCYNCGAKMEVLIDV